MNSKWLCFQRKIISKKDFYTTGSVFSFSRPSEVDVTVDLDDKHVLHPSFIALEGNPLDDLGNVKKVVYRFKRVWR